MLLNKKVANIFLEIAKLLEFLGENPFRVRAYEKASQRIGALPNSLEEYVKEGKLQELPGIGKDLALKIEEIYKTGTLSQYEELKKKVPEGVLKMLDIPGLGPKKVKILYEKLGIKGIEELQLAAKEGKLRELPGFGAKTEENILEGINFLSRNKGRMPIGKAYPIAMDLKNYLESSSFTKKVEVVGSIRRFKETVHDIDILVVAKDSKKVMDRFTSYNGIEKVIAKGEKKSSILVSGVQVDLRVFEEKSYGAALMYFTGSKAHNIKMREICLGKNLKLNEYGLFKGEKFVAGKKEEEIFNYLNMQWIPPEIREDSGEVELSLKKSLPILIEEKDILGDLHMHTNYSDGSESIENMVKEALRRGYKYIAITDHSQSLSVAGGMNKERTRKQIAEIKSIRKKYPEIKIFAGMEVDILADGSLDCDEELLDELDIVVAAVHTRFKMKKDEMTKRIVRAISHRKVNVLAHPTGRIIGERAPYELDMEKIMETAKKCKVALELNSYPDRLDLKAEHCRMAKEIGVKVAINTDAHSSNQLGYISFGVKTARRGWLEKKDVLNCMPQKELLKFLKKA